MPPVSQAFHSIDGESGLAIATPLLPLGYLAWAACGKDPGFSPAGILEQAARSSYSAAEVLTLAFATEPPDAGDLSRLCRAMLTTGREIVEGLPHMEVGRCVRSRVAARTPPDRNETQAGPAGGRLTT
jgi:hypothetical protein